MAGENTRTTWDPFLFDLKGKVWEVFPSEAPFLAEISGFDNSSGKVDRASKVQRISSDMDAGRDIFSGRQVRHTIILAGLQGGGNPTETGTWNLPAALSSAEVHIKLVRFLVPFSVTVDVERDSFDNSNATAVATLVAQARSACARLENMEFLADGTGKFGDITAGSAATATFSAATFNPDILLPGTTWDIRTVSTGAVKASNLTIVSLVESTRVVTFDGTTSAASGDGLYVQDTRGPSVPTPGAQYAQGLEQAAAITGTFEDVNKATTVQWQGVDGRLGDTNVLPLTDQIMDAAVRRGRRSGLDVWDFAIGDPAVIDLYKQGKYALVRYEPEVTTLKSGFSGIVYDGAGRPFPLIKEPAHKKGALKLIDKESFQLYGDQAGPAFLEDDGAMFRRVGTRSLPKEADMLDRVQLGVTKCNTIVFLNDLAVA